MPGTVLDASDTKRIKQSLHLHRTYISSEKTEKYIWMYVFFNAKVVGKRYEKK